MDVWAVLCSSCSLVLTKASSWVSDLSTLGIWVCARRSIAPRRARVQRRGRPISEKALVILECNEAFENGIVPVERTDQRPRPVADLILETDFAGRGPLQRPV